MALQTIVYLKTKFETGDVPTQQDFYDLLESYLHLSMITQVTGSSTTDVMSQKAVTDAIAALGAGVVVAATYTDIAGMLAAQGAQTAGKWYMVQNATTDPTVTTGWAIYNKLAPSTANLSNYQKIMEQESLDVAISNASETIKGISEEATDAEVTAGTATGGTGAKLFVTPAKLATRIATLITALDLNSKANRLWQITSKTGSYTMAAAELAVLAVGGSLVMESTTGDLTLPLNVTVAFSIGDTFAVRGFANMVATGGVSLTGTNGTLVIPTNRTCIVEKTGTNTWLLHNGSATSAAWTTTSAGVVIESTQAQAEAVASGAATGSTAGLSQTRASSEFGLYYFIRKFLTLAQTFSIGPIISDATASTPAWFSSTKKVVTAVVADMLDWLGINPTLNVVTASGGNLALDWLSKRYKKFVCSTQITGATAIVRSNVTNSEGGVLLVNITSGSALTFDSGTRFPVDTPGITNPLTTPIFTPTVTGIYRITWEKYDATYTLTGVSSTINL